MSLGEVYRVGCIEMRTHGRPWLACGFELRDRDTPRFR